MNIDEFRFRRRIMCGGGILDIGIYCLSFVTWIFGDREPHEIQTLGALNEDAVDEYASVNMRFGEKGIATFCYSISHDYENCAFVFGTKGMIKVSKF